MKSILCAKKKKRLQSLVGHTGFYFFSNIKKFTLIEINFVMFFFIFKSVITTVLVETSHQIHSESLLPCSG